MLHIIQNQAGRIFTRTPPRDDITEVLIDLHYYNFALTNELARTLQLGEHVMNRNKHACVDLQKVCILVFT